MPAPASFFIKKPCFRGGHVIVEQLVLLDNKFKVCPSGTQQFYHDTAATFEAYVFIRGDQTLQYILKAPDGFAVKGSGKGLPGAARCSAP